MKVLLNWFVLIVSIAVIVSSCSEEDESTTVATPTTTDDSSDDSTTTDTTSSSSASSATAIAVGNYHSCALLDNASVKCWGRNNKGQLGIDNTTNMGDDSGEMGDNLNAIDL